MCESKFQEPLDQHENLRHRAQSAMMLDHLLTLFLEIVTRLDRDLTVIVAKSESY